MFENVTLKLKIEEKEGAKDMNIYTSASEIIIGTGLDCNLRIHEPSIERYHLKINIPNKQVWVMGKDVYLNDNLLDVNAHHSFEYGDTIRIHRVFITLQPTEPNTETNGKYILKHIPDIMKENDVNVVSFDQEQIGTNVYVNNIGKVSDGQVDDKIVDDKIVDDKIVDDKIVDGNKETTIEREIISNQFIEGGILHQEITERIHIEEVEEIIICDKKEEETSIKEEEEETSIKDVPEIQQAVKILEDGNVEMALEDGDLTTVKEAINLKKEDLNTDIRDTIEAESTVSDTPIDPSISKRVVKDLGEVVLEKEILSDAEKIVDEKIVDEKKDEEAIEKNEKDSVETVSVEENKNQVENKVETENKVENKVETENKVENKVDPVIKDQPTKKTKRETKSSAVPSSILNRTPRRAASQVNLSTPLPALPPKRTSRRNSSVPQAEDKKSSRTKK